MLFLSISVRVISSSHGLCNWVILLYFQDPPSCIYIVIILTGFLCIQTNSYTVDISEFSTRHPEMPPYLLDSRSPNIHFYDVLPILLFCFSACIIHHKVSSFGLSNTYWQGLRVIFLLFCL